MDIQALIDKVKQADTVEKSATALINSIPALIQAAVDKVLAGGVVTPEQMQPLQDVIDQLAASDADLNAAVVANTQSEV